MDPAPRLRLALPDEIEAIDDLMKQTTRDIFPRYYDANQTEASVAYISAVDPMLIEDRTYFVIEAAAEIVACGGGAGATSSTPARVRATTTLASSTRRRSRRARGRCSFALTGPGGASA